MLVATCRCVSNPSIPFASDYLLSTASLNHRLVPIPLPQLMIQVQNGSLRKDKRPTARTWFPHRSRILGSDT
jgi:hypothetical protein